MILLVDSREQSPFWKPCKTVHRCTLKEGDYTTTILYNKFHIERKSLQDLYGTITKGHARFRREIKRAEEKRIKLVVVVEGTHKDFINKNFPRGKDRKVSTEALRKTIDTIKRRYDLEIIFCKTRDKAIQLTLKRFRYEEKNFKKGSDAKNR